MADSNYNYLNNIEIHLRAKELDITAKLLYAYA
jgi:hypothetical protein